MTSVFVDCPVSQNCKGSGGDAARCPKGFAMPLCGACDENYYPAGSGRCDECRDGNWNLTLMIIGGPTTTTLLTIVQHKHSSITIKLKFLLYMY